MKHTFEPRSRGAARMAVLVASALALGASGALAGAKHRPLETPRVALPEQPAPAPARYDWSGPYGGVQLGYAFRGDDEVGLRGDNIQGNRIIGDLELSGPMVGIHAGHNWHRHDDNIVFGIEGGIGWANINDNTASNGNSASSEIDVTATLRGRLGYAMDRNLLYVSGGLAAGRIDYQAESAEGGTISDRSTRVGYTLGLGVETAIDNSWTLRGEYNYSNYRGNTLTGTNNLETRATPDHHWVTVGVNRRF